MVLCTSSCWKCYTYNLLLVLFVDEVLQTRQTVLFGLKKIIDLFFTLSFLLKKFLIKWISLIELVLGETYNNFFR